jgi:hypothetical protein
MQTRQIVGLCLIPLALLVAASTITLAGIGSVVWFAGMLGSAVLILTLLSFGYGLAPSAIPTRSLSLIYIASVVTVGVGVLIRVCYHEELKPWWATLPARQQPSLSFWVICGLYEWLSFAGILLCVFWVAARRGGENPPKQPSQEPPAPAVTPAAFGIKPPDSLP